MKKYFRKNKSIKAIGIFLLVFSIANFLRHSMFFFTLYRIVELFQNDLGFLLYLLRESIWFVVSVWIVSRGMRLVRKHGEIEYSEYVKTKEFFALSSIVCLLFVLEIPIHDIHYDLFDSPHGHGFWDSGTHIH